MTLNEKLHNHTLILGSASPRRRDLIEHLGLSFTIRTADIDEHAPAGFDGFETAMHVAKEKAAALKPALQQGEILITADTEVWQNRTRFGKPVDDADARRMLNLLIGNKHQVISGVCFTTVGRTALFYGGHRCAHACAEARRNRLLHHQWPSVRQSRCLRHPGMDRSGGH